MYININTKCHMNCVNLILIWGWCDLPQWERKSFEWLSDSDKTTNGAMWNPLRLSDDQMKISKLFMTWNRSSLSYFFCFHTFYLATHAWWKSTLVSAANHWRILPIILQRMDFVSVYPILYFTFFFVVDYLLPPPTHKHHKHLLTIQYFNVLLKKR